MTRATRYYRLLLRYRQSVLPWAMFAELKRVQDTDTD